MDPKVRPYSNLAGQEWADWEFELPYDPDDSRYRLYPDLTADGCVPPGWVVDSTVALPDLSVDLALCQHPEQFWVIVRRDRAKVAANAYSRLHWIDLTVEATYNGVREDGIDSGDQRAMDKAVEAWLRGLLVERYDQSDEAEAAARTIVALGGPATLPSRTTR